MTKPAAPKTDQKGNADKAPKTDGDHKGNLDDKGDKGKPVGPGGKDANGCTIDHTHFVGDTGSLAWGFKESWRKYISNKNFGAHWELSDGAGWDAAKNQWTWKVKKSDFNLPTHDLKIQYQGTVHFLSHPNPNGDGSYLLDMKWIDPVYVFSMKDNTAKIQMHVISRDEQTQKYVDFGVIDFAQLGQQKVGHGQSGDKFNLSISGTKVYLTEDGAKVFGAYKKGQELEGFDTTAPLAPQKTCPDKAQGTGGKGQGGTAPKTDGGKAPSTGNTDKGAGSKAGTDQGSAPKTDTKKGDGNKAPAAGTVDKSKTKPANPTAGQGGAPTTDGILPNIDQDTQLKTDVSNQPKQNQGQQPKADQAKRSAPAGQAGQKKPAGTGAKNAAACTIDLKHLVGDTGSLAWGFKDSWQRYISNKGFDAHWQLSDGAGWDAAKKQWTWKVKSATFDVPKHNLKIQYQGTVHFLSHPAGDGTYLLDMKWIDPVYVYSKETGIAKIQMHVYSRDENTKKYVDFGLIDFALVGNQKVSHPQTGARFDVAINASNVTLTEAGAKVFGAYKKGQELLDASVAVTLVGQKVCGGQPQTLGAKTTAGKGAAGDGNKTPSTDSTAGKGGDQAPAAQNPAAPSSPTPQLPPAARPLLPPPPAPQQPAKKACTPDPNRMRVTGGSLSWGIRASFTTYIRGLAKGSWDLADGVRWDGSHFVFPAASGTYNKATRQGTINYRGAIHFTGHHGVLNLKLWNPTLQINGDQATLYMSGSSTDMSGKPVPVGRVAFATLHLDNLSVNGSKLTFSASDVHLTAAGTKAFAGFYKTGEKLDGLSGTADLVMATSCDADGNLLYYGADGKWHKAGAGLAKTGTQAGALLSLSSLLVAAGCVALATRRRRRDRVA